MLAAVAVVLAAAPGLAPAPAGAEATWTPPVAERFIAGPARAAVAPWGLAHNPVNGELVVGDYLANRLRRYSTDGVHLGDFADPGGNAGGVASGVAVDPRDGAVYVAVTGDGGPSDDVRKYRADGTFLFDFDVPAGATWLAVRPDGVLVVPEAFGGTIRLVTVDDAAGTATVGPVFGPRSGRLTGVDVAADGTMYVAHPTSGVVRVFASSGQQLRTIGSRDVFPGDIRGVLLDEAAGRLYVADAQTGEIDVFGLDGAHVGQIGGLGTGAGQFPDGARQLERLPDGTLLAADYGGRRVQRFAPDGRLLGAFPHPGQDAAPDGVVEPRGVAVDPATGDVIVADPWAQRVQRFAPDGRLLDVHGIRGSFTPDGMNYPRSVAVDPATGDLWVPNYEGDPDLVVYDRDFGVRRQIDTPRFVNDVEIVGGLAYLLVRRPGEVRVHDVASGALVRSFPVTGLVRGLGVDPATGDLWITSDTTRDLYVYGATGTLRRTLQVDNRGWGVAVAGDVVYVADAAASRIIAYDRVAGSRLGVVGAPGNALGQVNGPSGLTTGPGGRLVVVEQRNSRVQVFGPGPVPAADGAGPAVTWTGPAHGATSAAWPVTVGGRATDPAGVAQVQVAVRDVASGLLWDGINSRWGPWVWNQAVTAGPVEDGSWSYTHVPAVAGRAYQFTVRAIDRRGAISASFTRTFTFADVAPPAVAVATASLPRGVSAVTGTVADDIGPATVAVAVEDPSSAALVGPGRGRVGRRPGVHAGGGAGDAGRPGSRPGGSVAVAGRHDVVGRAVGRPPRPGDGRRGPLGRGGLGHGRGRHGRRHGPGHGRDQPGHLDQPGGRPAGGHRRRQPGGGGGRRGDPEPRHGAVVGRGHRHLGRDPALEPGDGGVPRRPGHVVDVPAGAPGGPLAHPGPRHRHGRPPRPRRGPLLLPRRLTASPTRPDHLPALWRSNVSQTGTNERRTSGEVGGDRAGGGRGRRRVPGRRRRRRLRVARRGRGRAPALGRGGRRRGGGGRRVGGRCRVGAARRDLTGARRLLLGRGRGALAPHPRVVGRVEHPRAHPERDRQPEGGDVHERDPHDGTVGGPVERTVSAGRPPG